MGRFAPNSSLLGATIFTTLTVLASEARAENLADEILLDTITVTTNKTPGKTINTLAGASVVTSVVIQRHQPNRASGVFNNVPGVNVQEDSDDPASVINIRGVQDFGRVNVMIEGARQNFQRSGHGGDGQVYIDPALISSVDITRGPVATINGSGAVGGVVNYNLLDPGDFIHPGETWGFSQTVAYDTNRDGFLNSTTLAVQPVESFGILGNFVFRDDGDYEDGSNNTVPYTGKELAAGLLKGNWQITPETNVKFIYLGQDWDYTTGASGVVRESKTTNNSVIAKLRHTSSNNPLVDVSVTGYANTTKTDQTRISGGRLQGNRRFFEVSTFGLDVFNTSRVATGAFNHAITYGGDIFRDQVTTLDPGGNGDEFTPSGERVAYGAFVQDEISYSTWLNVVLALRYDGYSLNGEGVKSDGDNLSPKVTVGVRPVKGVQIYGTYAEAYRAPSVTETLIEGVHPGFFAFVLMPNPNLDPETARNLEGGINLSFDGVVTDGDKFRAKANYFFNQIDDFIGSVYRPCPVGTCPFGDFQYVNIAEAEIHGFEFEGIYDFQHGFVQASYTNITGDDKTANAPLATVYPDKFVGTVGFRFLENALTVGGRWTSVAVQNRVPAGSPTSDAYDLFDLFAVYNHNRHFATSISLNNITDEQYIPYRQSENVPYPGFNAVLSATVKVGGT